MKLKSQFALCPLTYSYLIILIYGFLFKIRSALNLEIVINFEDVHLKF